MFTLVFYINTSLRLGSRSNNVNIFDFSWRNCKLYFYPFYYSSLENLRPFSNVYANRSSSSSETGCQFLVRLCTWGIRVREYVTATLRSAAAPSKSSKVSDEHGWSIVASSSVQHKQERDHRKSRWSYIWWVLISKDSKDELCHFQVSRLLRFCSVFW